MGLLPLVTLIAIVPVTLLLAVSFFILFVIRKIDTKGLKVFGYVITLFLWISAVVLFFSGISAMSAAKKISSMIPKMRRSQLLPGMMGGQLPGMMGGQLPGMMGGQMPDMPKSDKNPASK
jgi:hypothetical protein